MYRIPYMNDIIINFTIGVEACKDEIDSSVLCMENIIIMWHVQ